MSLEKVIKTKAQTFFYIYPVVAPANATYPYVVYEVLNSAPNHSKTEKSQLDISNVAFTCFAKTFAACKALAELVRSTYDNLSGNFDFGSGTNTGKYDILFWRWEDESDSGFIEEPEVYVRTLIFRIGHNIGN